MLFGRILKRLKGRDAFGSALSGLNRKRPLSIDMILKHWKGLHIPIESLIGSDNSNLNHHKHA